MWIGAILTTLVLMFGALNYGNTLRWNIRAQSVADSTAQGLLTIQTQRWNDLDEALYGANVEEYRSRSLLNGVLLALNNSGPCAAYIGKDATRDCTAVATALLPQYLQSVQRYTAAVGMLHAVAYNATRKTWDNDAAAFLTHIQKKENCNDPATITAAASIKPDGSDCPFKLAIVSATPRSGLGTVQYNAYTLLVPGLGKQSPQGLDTENVSLWAPLKIDVVACAKVPPLIPSFWKYSAQPYRAIARSAATAVMFVQDWFEPGRLLKPYTNPQQHFQNAENYVASTANGIYDWYAVDYGGNFATADPLAVDFVTPFVSDELSAWLGWWNAVPTQPFAAAPDPDAVCPP